MARGDKVLKVLHLEIPYDELEGVPRTDIVNTALHAKGFDLTQNVTHLGLHHNASGNRVLMYRQERMEYEHLGDAHED